MEFEPIIGLEVHVQLATKSKLFCSCSTEFGAEPNTHVCPVCGGLPGAVPVLNKEAVYQAVRAGIALNCNVQEVSAFDRKNYYYPDLPKSYQTTQMYKPICLGGHLTIEKENGDKKVINITRIHLEEDAGKLIHGEVNGTNCSFVDLNRSSMPLIEIVSEPEITSAEEARLYMQKIRTILLYAGVSDCNMEEGSLRCDANISIRPKGQKEFGTRVEIKNMNSFRNVQRAVEYEIARQKKEIASGGKIVQETRLWDNNKNITISMRVKEDADDYRYFPCSDLLPVVLENSLIEELKGKLPEMPDIKKARFIQEYHLPAYDAELLTSDINYANYFEECLKHINKPKQISNWVMSELLRVVNDKGVGIYDAGLSPKGLAGLVELLDKGIINGKQAKEVFAEAVTSGEAPADIVTRKGMAQNTDVDAIEKIVVEVLNSFPAEKERYKGGETKLTGFFVGEVMKQSKGKANPKIVSDILRKLLS